MRLTNRLLFLCSLSIFLYSCSKKDTPSPNPTPVPTNPACTSNSSPAQGGFVTSTSVTLNWTAANGATSYDVYLGTTSNPGTIVASNISGTSYTHSISTTPNQIYYWYVQPKNANGAASGCSSTVTSFQFIVISNPSAFGFYVVGYFPSYRDPNDVPDVKFRMTNIVNYAFFSVNTSGTTDVQNPTTLALVINKARANNAKVFVAINDGNGDGKTNFKNMAATAGGRNNFVKDIMNKVRQYGFDGVDIDWEYPTTSDGTDGTFTLLMKELSDSLHRDARYYLSAAITPGKYAGGIRDAIKSELFGYVDIFNVMAYDDFSTTAPYRQHSDLTLAQVCLNYWLTTRGMPPSKCVLGIPAYGRPSGITQTNTVLSFRAILSQGGSPNSDSALVTSGGFTNYVIYYNGQTTVKKKAIMAKQIANGVMMWEKWQDAPDGNSLLKAACDTVGRSY
jgi:GH18 family chitinase